MEINEFMAYQRNVWRDVRVSQRESIDEVDNEKIEVTGDSIQRQEG